MPPGFTIRRQCIMAAVLPSRAPLTRFTVWDAQKFRIIGHASSASGLTGPEAFEGLEYHKRRRRRAGECDRLPMSEIRARNDGCHQPRHASRHKSLSEALLQPPNVGSYSSF